MTHTENKHISDCCRAPIKTAGGVGDFSDHEEGITMHWECEKCGKACNDLFYTENKKSSLIKEVLE